MIAGRSVALLFIHDGRRPALDLCVASAMLQLPRFDQIVWVDDSRRELGFSGAIQRGWDEVETDYVFHLEQDFILKHPVPLADMVSLLIMNPHLIQVALKRQPVNEHERAAGGIIEMRPDEYEQRLGWIEYADGRNRRVVWVEHRVGFTTNPCVYSSRLCARGWPQREHSEGHFGLELLAEDPELRSAYWGAKDQDPWVEHIGQRGGWGY